MLNIILLLMFVNDNDHYFILCIFLSRVVMIINHSLPLPSNNHQNKDQITMQSSNFKLLLITMCYFLALQSNAQAEKIEAYFEALKEDKKHPETTISFVQEEMGLVEDYSKLAQIILVRHGEPALNKTRRRNRKEAVQFAKDYDSVGIYAPAFIPVTITADELKVIHTSSINRSISTAQKVFNREDLQQPDTLFREFERKIFPFPNIRLRTKWWNIGSRILWFLGVNKKGVESFSNAKKRVRASSRFPDS
jgi:hypothetical protein